MRNIDNILLEQAYYKVLLRENPDSSINPATNKRCSYEDLDARAFGYVNIDKEFTLTDAKLPLVFKGFSPEWRNKFYITPSKQVSQVGQRNFIGIHFELLTPIMKDILDSKQGIIEGGIFDNVIDNPDYVNKTLDLSNNYLDPEEFARFTNLLINKKLHHTIGYMFREFLKPSGRIWTNSGVVSFWSKQESVKPEHLSLLFNNVNIPEDQANQFYIEFLGDKQPTQTVGDFLAGTDETSYSEEEQAARDKKAAEDLAKAHEVAAVGTKDKDVQKIIAARKKNLMDFRAKMEADGWIGSFKDRWKNRSGD
jgi:hypothetical protein